MSWIIEKFKKFNNKTSIIYKKKLYTYDELYYKIYKYYKIIKNKIEKGEIVAIIGDYSFDNIALLFALYLNKNIIVPITSKNDEEILNKLKESGCTKSITTDEDFKIENLNFKKSYELILKLQHQHKSGLILFSSGITGKPKAMIHDFNKFIENYKFKKEKNLNILIFLMFDHIGGLNTLLMILSTGATGIIPESRNAEEICKLIQDYKINVLPVTPTFLNLILISKSHRKYDLSSLKLISYGTEAMPETLLKKLKKEFPNVKFVQTFGTSETGIINTKSKSSDSVYIKLDDKNIDYKIVNGELWIKSNTQILGYLNYSMDNFTDDGWFKTGDLVERDENGFLKIIGRVKDIINVGGEKVFPAEVESVILEIPEVLDCVAYGEKNLLTGESVAVDVVLKEKIDKKELKRKIRKICRERLENFKIPTKVNIVEKINFSTRYKKLRKIHG